MTILDYIRRWATECPDRVAVSSSHQRITYAELLPRMEQCDPLPLPLLGDRWDGDFCLHTTGTTGKAKGVVISHAAVMANTDNLIQGQGFSHNLIFIIAGDMTHLGCWSKIFPVLRLGGTLLILEDGMKDIEAFFAALSTDPATLGQPSDAKFATFLVPSNIRILLQFSGDRLAHHADSIDFIETGAAPMPHSDMLRLCQLLPHSRLYNTYASTETGIVATYNYNDGRCIPGCLGKPLPHSRIIITPEGRIACQGDTLMSGYEPTPQPPAGGTFVTNDNGFIDEDGMLHILGREDDIINVGGYKVAPSEVEEAALAFPVVKDCICIPFTHPILGQAPELIVVTNDGCTLDKRALARHIASLLEPYKVPLRYRQEDHVERTHNGKLNRKAYRELVV